MSGDWPTGAVPYFNGAAIQYQIDYQHHIEELEAQLWELTRERFSVALDAVALMVRNSDRTRIQALAEAINITTRDQQRRAAS